MGDILVIVPLHLQLPDFFIQNNLFIFYFIN